MHLPRLRRPHASRGPSPCVLAALLALLVGLVAPPAARAQAPEWARVEALLAEAASLDSLLAWAPLLETGAVLQALDAAQAADRMTAALEAASGADPGYRTALAFAVLPQLRRAGRVDEARALERQLGLLDAWYAVGPFPNDGNVHVRQPLPPELDGGALTGVWAGRGADVTWRPIEGTTDLGYLDLLQFQRPAFGVATLLWTELVVDRRVEAVLDLAIDGAWRLWLDGEPVAGVDEHRGGGFVRETVSLTLTPGTHALVFRIALDEGAFGLHARLTGPDGRALPQVTVRQPSAAGIGPLTQPAVWPAPRTLTERLDEAVARRPSPDAWAQAALVARVLLSRQPDQPWNEYADRALQAGEPSGDGWRRLSLAADEPWRAMERADRAMALDPSLENALHALQLHAAELAVQGRFAAAALVGTLRGRFPDSVRVAGLEASLATSAQFHYRALASWRGLLESAGDSLLAVRGAVEAAREVNRWDLVADLLPRWVAQDATATEAVRAWLRGAEATDTQPQASAALATLHALRPHDLDVRRLLARDAEHRGLADEARAHRDALLAQCPTDAAAWRDEGERALLVHDREAATLAFTRAVALNPQDADLRALIDHVGSGPTDRFWEAWRVPLDDLRARADALSPPPDVDATRLLDQTIVRVYPNGLATTWTQRATTLHTRNAVEDHRNLLIGYAADSELIDQIQVRILGPGRTLRETWSQSDFGPPAGPQSIYFDVRTRVLSFPALNVGDTLVVEYALSDIAYRNLFDDYFGDIRLVQDQSPVEHYRYAVLMPAHRPLQVAVTPSDLAPWTVTPQGEVTHYVWEAREVPRLPREGLTPGWSEVAAHLHVSTWESWGPLADWYWQLIRGQLVLTPEMRTLAREITAGLEDDRARIAAIYRWVVRNIRYVGLEFGIHGYKPYRTSECFGRRFGDCKDTASLLKVLLEAVGIRAHLVLVRTRDLGRIDGELPSLAVFNHAIAWVPDHDLYLDGTAAFSGSGELPTMDQGASSLIVLDGEGGRFGVIPFLDAEASVDETFLRGDLRGAQPAGQGQVRATGSFAAGLRRGWESEAQGERRVEERVQAGVRGIRLADIALAGIADPEAPVEATFTWQGGEFIRGSGEAVEIPLFGAGGSLSRRYAGASTRTLPLEVGAPFTLREGLELTLPDDWVPVELPETQRIEGSFGRSEVETAWDPQTRILRTLWTFRMEATRVEPADYAEFREFVTRVDATVARVSRWRRTTPGGAP